MMEFKKMFVLSSSKNDIEIFNDKIDKRFDVKYYDNKDTLNENNLKNLFLLNFNFNDFFDHLLIPEYFSEIDTTEIPSFQTFDPRFTIGILFNHLTDELMFKGSINKLTLENFHWSDWADLSILDSYYLDPKKSSCGELFDTRTKNKMRNRKLEFLDPEEYCFHDDDIDKILSKPDEYDSRFIENVEQVKSLPYSTGWHIYNYGGRSKKHLKILQSKSYLNDFMHPPSSIVFLLPGNKQRHLINYSLKLNVNQNLKNRRKMIHTEMVTRYATKFRLINLAIMDTTKDIVLSIKKEIFALTDKVIEINTKEDSIKKNKIFYEKHLTPEHFTDNSSAILEHMKSLDEAYLSPSELNYRESLELSLGTLLPKKYFNEAKLLKKEPNWSLGAHYDWRFFSGIINFTSKQPSVLHGLVKAWLTFTNTYHLNTWIAHGSLLAWYWNGVGFPWDNDIDVQMPIADLHKLSQLFNQSMIVDLDGGSESNEIRYGRYFLDCGTFISTRTRSNGNNNIDARFIDVDTGLYIDITGIALSNTGAPDRYSKLLPKSLSRNLPSKEVTEIDRNKALQAYNCRNNHFLLLNEISPLKLSIFEGQPAYIPNHFGTILTNEYGQKGIMAKKFKGYTFLPKLRTWVLARTLSSFLQNHDLKREKQKNFYYDKGNLHYKKQNVRRKVSPAVAQEYDSIPVQHFKDEDYIDLLFDQENLLIEYILTRNITQFHEDELERLLRGQSTESLLMDAKTNELTVDFPPLRHDLFTFNAHRNNYKFENMINDKLKDINLSTGSGGFRDITKGSIEAKSVFEEDDEQEERFLQISQRNSSTSVPLVQENLLGEDGLPKIALLTQSEEERDDMTMNRYDRQPNDPPE